MTTQYGATTEEWRILSEDLGLTADLLPVVSNPNAKISAHSAMKSTGKTPSHYNGRHEVAGISDWTNYKATKSDIEKWSKEPDYGICIQTREVRAIDIDIPTTTTVAEVLNIIDDLLEPIRLPVRQRPNNAKCLLAFQIPGALPKRVIKTADGIIEFLATGQQFVALGTHPSGVKYEWDWCDNSDFPELTLEQFERLWKALQDKFGIAPSSEGSLRKNGEDLNLEDDTLERLNILGYGSDGQAHITCPFASEHTTDTGISSTSYFPKGTGGYEKGHFVCLHAHCSNRTDGDFINALGIVADQFEDLSATVDSDKVSASESNDSFAKTTVVDRNLETTPGQLARPGFKRTKTGEVICDANNLKAALMRPDVCGAKIAYDSFRDEVVITDPNNSALAWRPLNDDDYTFIQCHLEKAICFQKLDYKLLVRIVNLVAKINSFDSAQIWLDALVWDGVKRIDRFAADYWGTSDSEYHRGVSRYFWSAAAGRVIIPGVKTDMTPILCGPQGAIKSSSVAALAPSPEYFVEISFHESTAENARRIRGKLIAEIPELHGLHTRELEGIKAWATRTHEEWRPLYKEKNTKFARRFVAIGTTNQKELFSDETGNRRWLPVDVTRININAIIKDRDQLWAEAKVLFMEKGVCYKDVEKLAPTVHGNYLITDSREALIKDWMYSENDLTGLVPMDEGYVRMQDVLRYALGYDGHNLKGHEAKAVAKILRMIGLDRIKKRFGEHIEWVWVLKPTEDGSDLV